LSCFADYINLSALFFYLFGCEKATFLKWLLFLVYGQASRGISPSLSLQTDFRQGYAWEEVCFQGIGLGLDVDVLSCRIGA
jgi:hypothetical protein